MILFLAGDAWTWDATLRYDDPLGGAAFVERERWTVRFGPKGAFAAERTYVGSVVDDTLVKASDVRPETLKGRVERDGTLSLEGDWSDPVAARALRRLLNPAKALADRVSGWPVVRAATLGGFSANLPGSDRSAEVTVEARLVSARLGGKDVEVKKIVVP